jgi:transcriptional regulator with XRE-family HTH domain
MSTAATSQADLKRLRQSSAGRGLAQGPRQQVGTRAQRRPAGRGEVSRRGDPGDAFPAVAAAPPEAAARPLCGAILRALREARGVSQDGWATWLGVGTRTVQRWESDASVPDEPAERALLAVCNKHGLFRTYDCGPLQGQTLTPDLMTELLAAARLGAHARPPGRAESGLPTSQTNLPVPLSSFVGSTS